MEFVNSAYKGKQNGGNSTGAKPKSKSRQNGSKGHQNANGSSSSSGSRNYHNDGGLSKQKYHQIVTSAIEQGKRVGGNKGQPGQNFPPLNGYNSGANLNMSTNLGALFNGLVLKNQHQQDKQTNRSQSRGKGGKSYSNVATTTTNLGKSSQSQVQPSHEELTLRLNTEALQRLDPAFTKLYGSASQVAVYDFDAVTSYWTDTKTVGCLFLYHRSKSPNYGLVVLNRKGLENLVIYFDKESQIIPQKPYLLFRRGSTETINCIWFYKDTEFHTVTELFRQMGVHFDCDEAGVDNEAQGSPEKPQQEATGPMLFDMLQKSQTKVDDIATKGKILTAEELEKQMLSDTRDASKKENVNPHPARLLSLGADEPGSSLLKKFSLMPQSNNAAFSGKLERSNGNGLSPSLNDASRSRSMKTVEQLEKDFMPTKKGQDSSKKDISNELLATLGISHIKDELKDCSAAESNSDAVSPFMTPMSRSRSESDRSTRKLTIDDLDGKLYEETDEDMVREVVENLADLTELLLLSENVAGHSEPQLVWRKRSNLQNRPSSALIQIPQINNVPGATRETPLNDLNSVSPLTQTQLSQAIIYLFQTDPSFTSKIHEAYMKSLQPASSRPNRLL